jgi:acyl-CoA dehydrogenase
LAHAELDGQRYEYKDIFKFVAATVHAPEPVCQLPNADLVALRTAQVIEPDPMDVPISLGHRALLTNHESPIALAYPATHRNSLRYTSAPFSLESSEPMIRDQDMLDNLLATLDRFVTEDLIPREREVVETGAIPADVAKAMREMGLFGLTLPEAYGGMGLTMEEEVAVAFSLGRTSPAFRSLIGSNNGIGSLGIVTVGTEEQKQTYLPKLASGDLIGSFALTEPSSGSDSAALKTRADRQGDYYVLNGSKRFITNAPHAGIFTVFARTDQSKAGSAGISAFLVERNAPGLSLGAIDKKMGQAGSVTCDVMFENCKVPASALLGKENEGFKIAMRTLDRGRLHIAAISVGAADRLIDESVRFASERKQFGEPIANFQLIQAMLADSKTEAYAARCMIVDAARKRDTGIDITLEASASKLFATEMVGRVADRAVQIHGGSGYIQEYAVERFYRDVRLFRLYEGTSQIQQLVIAKRMLKDFQK